MKISVSLTEEDVAVLDRFVEQSRLSSRSAGVQRAVRMLQDLDLEAEYVEAFVDWDSSDDKPLWDTVASAGLRDEAR